MNNERFTVEVIEIRSRLVTVCADSEDSAINQVKKRYNKGQIEVKSIDYAGHHIRILKKKKELNFLSKLKIFFSDTVTE